MPFPDITDHGVWAAGGESVDPGSTKTQQGWVVEAPPYQYYNWWQNRTDQALVVLGTVIDTWDVDTVSLNSSSGNSSGAKNFVVGSPSNTVTGFGNLLFSSPGVSVTGDNNAILGANGTSFGGDRLVSAGSSGGSISSSSRAALLGSASSSVSGSLNAVVGSSSSSSVDGSNNSSVRDSLSSQVVGANQAAVLASSYVVNNVANSVAMGHALSGPASENNITIHLFAETGNAEFAGDVSVTGNLSSGSSSFTDLVVTGTTELQSTLDVVGGSTFQGNSIFQNDVTVQGNLTVQGSTVQVDSELVTADAVIMMNDGEVGAGVTNGFSGLEIDRGTETNYRLVFDEPTDTVRVGEVGSLQPLATREDTPLDGGTAVWNASTNRFETVDAQSSGFVTLSTDQTIDGNKTFTGANVFDAGTGISPPAPITLKRGVDLWEVYISSFDDQFTISRNDSIDFEIYPDGGVVLAAATGGSMGAGTVNAKGFHIDTVPVVTDNQPSDFWQDAGNATFYSSGKAGTGDTYGFVGSGGSYGLGIYWNGYRNDSGTWTSLGVNGFTGGYVVECNSGGILFRGDDNKATGSAIVPTERGRVHPDGGWTMGNPTDGSQGAGTINCQGIFVNGTEISGGASVSTTRLELGGDFSAGEEVVVQKVGSQVTITGADGLLSHTSGSIANSLDGLLPVEFRPSDSQQNCYEDSGDLAFRVKVTPSGQIQTWYNSASGGASRTNALCPTITYLIASEIA